MIVFDVLIPIVLFLAGIYLKDGFGEKFLYLMFAIGGSQLPDVIDGLIYTKILKNYSILKIENALHQKLHWHERGSIDVLLGLRDISQVLTILIALFLVIF